jgi:Ni/Co efflux regulator RcnB
MRYLTTITISALAALSSAAFAQSEREIRKDERRVQEQSEDLRNAQDRGSRADIEEAREDLRGARQELREDRRDQRTSMYVSPYRNWSQSTPDQGSRLRSKFYGSRYVISNLGDYGLSPVGRNQRGVRYGDDILLVNVRSGRVMQVMPNRYREI